MKTVRTASVQQHSQLESNHRLSRQWVLMKEKLFIKIIVEILELVNSRPLSELEEISPRARLWRG